MNANFDRVVFYCFSGTGNTLLAAERMAEVFEDARLDVATRLMFHIQEVFYK